MFMDKGCKKLTKAQLKKNPTEKVKLTFKSFEATKDDVKLWNKKTGTSLDWNFALEGTENEDGEVTEPLEMEGVFYNPDLRSRFGIITGDDPLEIEFDMTYFLKGMEHKWDAIVDLADADTVEACGERVKDKDGKYKDWVK